jgi:hypothetical protein
MSLVGALEVILVFVSRPAYERGISAPVEMCGILSAILIAGGLLPQYWEIYVLGEVKGVSYTFICIDMLGGLLNDLSLAFASEFDSLASVTYTLVTVSDLFILIFGTLIKICFIPRLGHGFGRNLRRYHLEPTCSETSSIGCCKHKYSRGQCRRPSS